VKMGSFTRRVDEPDRVDYKAWIKDRAVRAMGGMAPLEGPLAIHTVYYRVKPKSYPKRATKGHPWPFWPWKIPDMDNLGKILWDAVTKIVWQDDAQVVHQTTMKVFSGVERIVFRIMTIDEIEDPTLAWFLAGEHALESEDIPVQFTLEEEVPT